MELNIKEFKISGDSTDRTDSAYKSTLLNSKEEKINSNNENILVEINDNNKLNLDQLKGYNNNNNNITPVKSKIKSHKDKIMLLLSQEKSKIAKKESNFIIKKENINKGKKERTDRNGIPINKKNKRKVKITFIDQLDKKNKLVTEVKIESFKKYNVILGMPKDDYYDGTDKQNSKCCTCIVI